MKRYAVMMLTLVLVAVGGLTVAAEPTVGFNEDGAMSLISEPNASEQTLVFCRGDEELTPEDIPWVDSERGKAVRFNGVDEYFRLPVETLELSEFTLSFWVNWDGPTAADGTPTAANQRIFSAIGPSRSTQYVTLSPMETLPDGTALMRYYMNEPKAFFELNHPKRKALVANKWQHVVIVNRPGVVTVYVNELLLAEEPSEVTASALQLQQLFIGRGASAAGDGYYSGLMDNVYLFNRALTTEEVRRLNGQQTPNAFVPDSSTTHVEADTPAVPDVPLAADGTLPPIPPVVWIAAGAVLALGAVLTVAVNRHLGNRVPPAAPEPDDDE